MSFRVYFSIVLEEELKKGEWDPKTTKSEYTRGYSFDNDIDAIKLYNELREFGYNQYLAGVINNEKYFGIIVISRAGINTVIYIEKWEGFDEKLGCEIEFSNRKHKSEKDLVDFMTEKGFPDKIFYYMSDGVMNIYCGKWVWKESPVRYYYDNITIFGEAPKPDCPSDFLPF